MAGSQHQFKQTTHSHRWLGVLAFVTLLIVGGMGILLWRLPNISVQSMQGSSMAPLISSGDGVIASKTDQIESGDIISYYNPVKPTEILTARVSSVDEAKDLISVKGDNETKLRAPFSREVVIGVVKYRVAKLGYAANFLRTPVGLIISIYLPALIIIWLELRRLSSHYEQPSYSLKGYRVKHSH